MAKLFNGSINFPSTMTPTGAQPLDDRSVVKSLQDLLSSSTFGSAIYNGMMVSVVDEQKVYMLVDDTKSTQEEGWVAVGSGNGSIAVETYGEAVALATSDNVGQVIYVKTKSSYDVDGEEGEGEAVEYEAAPYIVIGAGSLMKLAASTASGSIEGDVAELRTKVGNLETTVGGAEKGLVKDVNDLQGVVGDGEKGLVKDVEDLKNAVAEIEIPEVPVQDVTVDGVSVLGEDGVAAITMPDLTVYEKLQDANDVRERLIKAEADILKKVEKVDGERLMTDAEGTKLEGMETGAQVNKLEKVKVNGAEILIADSDKSVDIIIPEAPVKGAAADDKIISISEDKLIKSTLALEYVKADAEGNNEKKPILRLTGKEGAVISSIDATDFIKDGMLDSVELVGPSTDESGEKYLSFTFNTDAGKDVIRLNVTDLIDYYYAGDGLIADGKTFSVKVSEDAYLQVTTDGINVSQKLFDKITELDNAVLASAKSHADTVASSAETNAKAYADGLNTAMDARVKELEEFDHSVYALANNVYTKEDADNTFVKTADFNEFTNDMESKLEGIAEGAQVNVIESVSVNGVDVTITDKKAEITFEADDIKLGTAITADEDGEPKEVYGTGSTITSVLQGIQNSITVAVSGGLTDVVAGDGMAVSAVSANKQTVSAKISKDDGNLLKVSETDKGLFVAMYYDGDDAE